MFEALMWPSITSCFTPTLLFLFLNLMIATIAFISKLTTRNHLQNESNSPDVAPSPSVHYLGIHDSDTLPNLDTQSQDFFQQVSESFQVPQSQASYLFEKSSEETETKFFSEPKDSSSDHSRNGFEEKVEENEPLSMDVVYSNLTTSSHFNRTQSDTGPASGHTPVKLPARMRKSASLKSAFGHFEEEDIVEARRPATVRAAEGDAEVDAKADDFIHRFREQLKLQRLESIIRYKNIIMTGGGGGS